MTGSATMILSPLHKEVLKLVTLNKMRNTMINRHQSGCLLQEGTQQLEQLFAENTFQGEVLTLQHL